MDAATAATAMAARVMTAAVVAVQKRTALVHEAFVRLINQQSVDWRSRGISLRSPPPSCAGSSSIMPARDFLQTWRGQPLRAWRKSPLIWSW